MYIHIHINIHTYIELYINIHIYTYIYKYNIGAYEALRESKFSSCCCILCDDPFPSPTCKKKCMRP